MLDINEGPANKGELRKTKEPIRIKISDKRISEIEGLIESWSFEMKEFMLQRLNQYKPGVSLPRLTRNTWYWFMDKDSALKFKNLKNPEILTNWKERFRASGEDNPTLAWNRILEKEVSYEDREYMIYRLKEETDDTFVPPQVADFFEKLYKAHIRKEYANDPDLPKAPIVLVIGPSGSGKSATVQAAIEKVIFENVLKPEKDYSKEVDDALYDYPLWTSLEEVAPKLAEEIERNKRVKSLKRQIKIPIYKRFIKDKVNKELLELEEEGLEVSYAMITPNDFMTAFSHEPGNFLKKAMGDPKVTSIRHLEEAHSACGKKDGSLGDNSHIKTLTDTMNILLDEISNGSRDCLLVMTTDQPEKFENAIYRRLVEKGKVLDMLPVWKDSKNLENIVEIELKRKNILVREDSEKYQGRFKTITHDELSKIVQKIYPIFESKTLNMVPAYVRKLISSIIELKGDIKESYLEEQFTIREAFKNVAKNIHGELYNKVVNKIPRAVKWDDYIGSVKDEFSKLANNCLLYNISEEKGAVLTGPPGSGKTFLAQAWLGEHPEVTDILLTLNVLKDSNNAYDTTAVVDNLEKLYDIAKMVAPSFVYGDEGDALAPRRAHGESQSDKVTNKLLSIIGGDRPLIGVFTALSTNRLDIMDPALVRSKRLKTMNITGHMKESDVYTIIGRKIGSLPKTKDVNNESVYRSAKTICNTPADYAAFVEEMTSLQKTEFEVIQNLKEAEKKSSLEEVLKLVKLNYKTLRSVIENINVPQEVKMDSRKDPSSIVKHVDKVYSAIKNINTINDYPLTKNHIETVKVDTAKSPTKKGIQQLGEFVYTQLSKEPQVGFVVGVGVMEDILGMLLPIGTSLTYKTSDNKIEITGAVKPSGGIGTAEIEMAVEMMKQSAQEALVLVENYLQALCPKDNIAKIIGEFLEGYTINHQLLTAQYTGGGPSAGFALTINTLSVIFNIPVFNDFGITGAPWTKGVTKGDVGSSVIIGGHSKKAEKVLQYLERMYMPQKNYEDMDIDFLVGYWEEKKDILGVKDFRSLVPEVICIDDTHKSAVHELIQKRIDYKKDMFLYYSKDTDMLARKEKEIDALGQKVKDYSEVEIIRRFECIKSYIESKDSRKAYKSMDEIFKY